jgi:gliding motility-associated-like protein
MNKNVFLYRNQQIPFGFFSSANLNKMIKLKRLFTFKLIKQNNYFNDLITVACLMFSVFCSVSVFGQTAPDAVLKSKTNVKCFGGNDGSIEVKVLSGSPIYRYSIFGGSPYQYSSKFVNLFAGNYVVTVRDTNGLTDTVQVIVAEPIKLKLSITSKSMVTCKSLSDGIVNLLATGGTSTYSYKLGSGTYQSSTNFSNISPGSSKFYVLDANGCADSVSIVITEPGQLTLSLSGNNVKCNGGGDGSVIANASGGTRPFRFRLGSSGLYKSDSSFINLPVGSYTVQILDTNNCATSKSMIITQPTALTLSGIVTSVDCKGNSTGSVVLSAGGGTSPYTYKNGTGSYQASAAFSTLAAGSYTFTVKDANGCTKTVSSMVSEPSVLVLNAAVTNPVCIQDKTGIIALSVTGGTSSFTYRLDSTVNSITKSFVATSTYNSLYQGKYSAEVKDANGCLDTVQVIIKHFDAVKPKPVPRKILTVYLGALGSVNVSANMADSISSDNCGIASLSISKTTFNCSNIGYNTVKFKIVDVNANSDSVNFIVNVKDTTRPKINTRNFTIYLDASGLANLSIDSVDLGSTDACGSVTRTLSKASFNCLNKGLNTVTYTAKDVNGNIATKSLKITVLDNIYPTLSLKMATLYLDKFGSAKLNKMDIDNGSYDNCNIDSMKLSDTLFNCSQIGVNVVTIKAYDPSLNITTKTVKVTVLDTIKPVLQVKNNTVYLDTSGSAKMSKYAVITLLFDNCGIDTLYVGKLIYSIADTGVNKVSVWAKDKSGNLIGPYTVDVTVIARDFDGDGIPDYIEGSKDTDGDGVFDFADMDSDNDGILDFTENEMAILAKDFDLDGKPNYKDLDSDNDGIFDIYEVDGSDPDKNGIAGTGSPIVNVQGVPMVANGGSGYGEIDTDGDGEPDYKDLDSDGDGISDITEGIVDTDADGIGNWRDADSDGDGISDKLEGVVDTDGDGKSDYIDTDSDNDGISDKIEGTLDTDGDGTGDWRDIDSDNDGISDKIEGTVDTDGDGSGDWRDIDADGDGIPDSVEGTVDTDGDGKGNWRDLDSDNDGIQDSFEAGSKPATPVDTDGDGKPDYLDLDSDADGIADTIEDVVDTDGDGISDFRDIDSDADGILDSLEGTVDTDGDVTGDWRDLDSDNDGISDKIEGSNDADGDGLGNWRDLDSDGDGISDQTEGSVDTDGDGISDFLDTDSDNDGILDSIEGIADTDGDGIGDWRDLDSDNDGISDKIEGTNDFDGDGIGNWRDLDSDNDGISDQAEGTVDTDGDGSGDWIDIDSDGDNILDSIEGTTDTDGDGIGNWRDTDSDGDGILDSLEGTNDFDGDGIGNWLDLDSDGDGIVDKTEGSADADGDSQGNWLDLDSDGDGISDKIEGTVDTDGDGIADYLDLDSDGDGILDSIEGTVDTDSDGTGDWRDLDSDNDGIFDKIEGTTDSDGDGTGNWRDLDSDGDGISDKIEGITDTDSDGTADYLDLDSDGDGIDDKTEGTIDTDGDGLGNWRDLDSDDDELLDSQEGTKDIDKDGVPDYIDPDFFVPEGISPNGDGINDQLYVRGLKSKVFTNPQIIVVNRWGQEVFNSGIGYKNDWDGKATQTGQALPDGVYYLIFKYADRTVSQNLYIKN